MPDFSKTIQYLKGALLDPRTTWEQYNNENPDWKTTAKQLTIPLVVASVVLTYIFSLIFSPWQPYGVMSTSFRFLIVSLVFTLIGYFVFSWLMAYLSGYFNGLNSLDKSLASITLAAVPAAVGSILGTLPFIGPILSIALSIYSLVLLYRNIPVFMQVPQESRVKHFTSTIVLAFIAAFVLSMIMQLFYWGGNYQVEDPGLQQGE